MTKQEHGFILEGSTAIYLRQHWEWDKVVFLLLHFSLLPLDHMRIKLEICIGSSLFTDLVYAEDTAFFVQSTQMQLIVCRALLSFLGLKMRVSRPQTKLQILSPGNKLYQVFTGNIDELVDNFIYFCSIQSSDGYCLLDIWWHIGLKSSFMSSLWRIWTLLATYTMNLKSFHMKCQRHILGVT